MKKGKGKGKGKQQQKTASFASSAKFTRFIRKP